MAQNISLREADPPFILALDVGSSSGRALLYDRGLRRVEDVDAQISHRLEVDDDGAAVLDPKALLDEMSEVIDRALKQADKRAGEIAAVGMATLVGNLLGLDTEGRPVTPIYTYADTRPAAQVEKLRRKLDVDAVYQRTGCPQHTAYMPARFQWFQETDPAGFNRVKRWCSLAEYMYGVWFDRRDVPMSYTVASWTGMLDRHRLEWDALLLDHLPVNDEQLSPLADYDQAVRGLSKRWAERWPALQEVPFFLAVGDGVAANVGSGCAVPERIALTLGTTGALRVILPDPAPHAPRGLWSYRADARRHLLGGALSNGGHVYTWLTERVRTDQGAALNHALAAQKPDGHGLTMLPFLAGERSPGYRSDATAAIVGLRSSTTPVQIVRAGLEAVAYRFALILDLLLEQTGDVQEIIAGGGTFQRAPAWSQILADVLAHPVVLSTVSETTSRGVAALALAALGESPGIEETSVLRGETYTPTEENTAIYRKALARQQDLYRRLLGA